MEEENCVMCGNDGMLQDRNTKEIFKRLFLAEETNELLCQRCFTNNEEIKRGK